jgi:Tfp pilus assembly protein PilO
MNKSFISPILFFVILLVSVYIVLPEFYNFNNFKKEFETRNQEILSIENYHKKIDDTFNELKNYEESLDKINSALPDNYSSPSLFNYLQKTSAENGMFLETVSLAKASAKGTKVSPGAETLKQNIKENYVNINLIGSYSSFKTFLESIEKSSRMIETENVLVEAEEETLNFILLLKVSSYN